jgi:hypothetical protein
MISFIIDIYKKQVHEMYTNLKEIVQAHIYINENKREYLQTLDEGAPTSPSSLFTNPLLK